MELQFLVHTIQAANQELTEEQAGSFLSAALVRANDKHHDFQRFVPVMEFLATAVFCDYKQIPLDDFIEVLYCTVKHGDFTRPWRAQIRKAA
jgi:hypothetical protein